MKSVVITGVSTGLGYGATNEFIKKGYHVFGSVRKQEDADKLIKEFGGSFTPLIFDITDHTAIASAARLVKEQLANNGLAGLINNAGAVDGSPLMHMPIESFRKHFEVLLIGQLAVIQQFLPLLGAQKQYPYKPGRIINITSVNGKIAVPFLGGYVAAKHAFDGLSDTLRIELQIYGIDVIIVAPGMIKTAIWGKVPEDIAETYRDTDYYIPGKNFNNYIKNAVPDNALELDDFSRRLIKIFELKRPKTRYIISRKKFKEWTLPRMLPVRLYDKFFVKLIGLRKT
jgi:NAD(P)-dependent dehydrogenase (short-subunit alcohol dehydrogenase family)